MIPGIENSLCLSVVLSSKVVQNIAERYRIIIRTQDIKGSRKNGDLGGLVSITILTTN